MTTAAWHGVRRHPVADVVERLHRELDAVAESSVWSMSPAEFRESLSGLTRLRSRVAELELRVAAGADRVEVGAHVGASSTASWWAHTTRQTGRAAHRLMQLARALDGAHERVGDALGAGEIRLEQAEVIIEAVEALPRDLVDPELVIRAEAHLIGLAREHDASALKILGRRVLEVLAPEIAEAHEQRVLDAEEAKAAQRCRFTISDDGHGASHGRFTLPSAQGEMLRKQLMAIAAPKHRAATGALADAPGERRSWPQRMGQAFGEWIERYPADALPRAGGVSATVVVTIAFETLTGGLKAAHLDTGAVISAAQARRLACEAGLIPVVLGGQSQVLDLGRQTRFHTKAQRIAMGLRDGGCTAQGCDWPPGLCHAHHNIAWSQGGHTTVEDGRLLCPHHHTRAHDPAYETTHLPGGKVAFTRRT